MTLLIRVIFICLILLVSPEEQKIQKFNMPGDISNLSNAAKSCCKSKI